MLIIGLSANASGSSINEAFKWGMHFYCPKPAENSLLCTIMNMKKKSSSLKDAIKCIQKEIETGDSIVQSKETFARQQSTEKKVSISKRQIQIPSPRTYLSQPKTPIK
jgi:hypothetical protein